MEAIRDYALSLGWVVCFLLLAALARFGFGLITPISLREASAQRNAAIGRVLRGLYIGLAIILSAAIRASISRTSPASPPNRCSQPVTSRISPCEGSSATIGV